MKSSMLSVHLHAGQIELRNEPVPERREGYALIRVLLAGICNTDIELRRGYYNFSGRPGHEFVGIVEECDSPDLKGKRVVGEINIGCGKCYWCISIIQRHCQERTVMGIVNHPGAFAEYLTLPERNLHVVPDNISNEIAVFVEPLAAACRIFDQIDIRRQTPVAVLGDGKLGLLISQVLMTRELRVHQYGRHPEKLAIAKRQGVETHLHGDLPRKEYEYVVDATGSGEGLQMAVSMTQPKGVVILKSTVHGLVPIDTAPIIVDELTIVGSRCGCFEPALELIREGAVDVESLIAARYPLSQAVEAFEHAERRGTLKVLLEP